jgi:hypothetical protein
MFNLEIGKLYNNFLAEEGAAYINASKGVIGPLIHFGTTIVMLYTYEVPCFLCQHINFSYPLLNAFRSFTKRFFVHFSAIFLVFQSHCFGFIVQWRD